MMNPQGIAAGFVGATVVHLFHDIYALIRHERRGYGAISFDLVLILASVMIMVFWK